MFDVANDGNAIGNEGGDEPERMDPSQAYAAIAAADARLEQLRSEPEKIRQWREENTKLLAEKGYIAMPILHFYCISCFL